MSPTGYPMTFQRFVNRNGLQGGDGYTGASQHIGRVNLDGPHLLADEQAFEAALAHTWRGEVRRLYSLLTNLLGDLRRLERDAVDEDAVCKHIAERTGVDAEAVAVVLKEFLAW